MTQRKAVVVLSGSLNPVTRSHFSVLLTAARHLEAQGYCVERLIFSPTHENYPYKRLESSERRLEMLRLSIEQQEHPERFEICRLEVDNQAGFQPLYIAMQAIKAHYAAFEVFMGCGEDLLLFMSQEDKWHRDHLQQLFYAAKIIAVRRTGGLGRIERDSYCREWRQRNDLSEYLDRGCVSIIDESVGDYSSTAVRLGDHEGCYESVHEFIYKHHLYLD